MAISNGSSCSIKKVLVLGDTRLSDSIVPGLSHAGFEVHQVVHKQSTSGSADRVTIHKTGNDSNTLTPLVQDLKPDIIFSTQSAGSYDFQKRIIDVAIAENVKRFVATEFKDDALNLKIQERLPPVKERARVLQYLKEQAAQGQIEWAAVATGCSLEHGLGSGNLGFDLKWQSATIHGTGKERFAASSTSWSGRVAPALLLHWEEVKNRYLYASELVTCANEILDLIKQRTSQQWEAGYVPVQEIVEEAEKRFERGFPDAGMFLMERSVLFDESVEGLRPFVQDDAKAQLALNSDGSKALEGIVQRVVHEAKHHGKADCGCG